MYLVTEQIEERNMYNKETLMSVHLSLSLILCVFHLNMGDDETDKNATYG
jgi:hypothetical protein